MIVNQYELKILLKVVVSMVLCQSERISFLALKVRGTEKDRTQCSHLKERFTSWVTVISTQILHVFLPFN